MANSGFHTASSGLLGYQSAIDITANNMANINTNGFKASRPSFSDIYYRRWRENERVDFGNGTRIDKTDLMFEQSALKDTGAILDFAAMDEGFFAVENAGRILYTKDGSFGLTQEVEGGDWLLTDGRGGYVLDYDGERITVPFIEDTTHIDAPALRELIGIYSFENPYGLRQIGSNYFEATLSSGEAVADIELGKMQGFLEASSADTGNEMTKVIEYQRALQINATMVKTYGELGDTVNNLRH